MVTHFRQIHVTCSALRPGLPRSGYSQAKSRLDTSRKEREKTRERKEAKRVYCSLPPLLTTSGLLVSQGKWSRQWSETRILQPHVATGAFRARARVFLSLDLTNPTSACGSKALRQASVYRIWLACESRRISGSRFSLAGRRVEQEPQNRMLPQATPWYSKENVHSILKGAWTGAWTPFILVNTNRCNFCLFYSSRGKYYSAYDTSRPIVTEVPNLTFV